MKKTVLIFAFYYLLANGLVSFKFEVCCQIDLPVLKQMPVRNKSIVSHHFCGKTEVCFATTTYIVQAMACNEKSALFVFKQLSKFTAAVKRRRRTVTRKRNSTAEIVNKREYTHSVRELVHRLIIIQLLIGFKSAQFRFKRFD